MKNIKYWRHRKWLWDIQKLLKSKDLVLEPLETPEYRLVEAMEDSSENSETEDMSDAAFMKRHLKPENREKLVVSADKRQQLEKVEKRLREKRNNNHEKEATKDFLRLYRYSYWY